MLASGRNQPPAISRPARESFCLISCNSKALVDHSLPLSIRSAASRNFVPPSVHNRRDVMTEQTHASISEARGNSSHVGVYVYSFAGGRTPQACNAWYVSSSTLCAAARASRGSRSSLTSTGCLLSRSCRYLVAVLSLVLTSREVAAAKQNATENGRSAHRVLCENSLADGLLHT